MVKIIKLVLGVAILSGVVLVARGVGGAFNNSSNIGGETSSSSGVLGVMSEGRLLEPPQEFATSIIKQAESKVKDVTLGVANAVSAKVADTITQKTTEEVSKNFQNLSGTEKEILRKAICQ